jgi:RNA polymerase sigma factor (sigma-70 family)
MRKSPPAELVDLLKASDADSREKAWSAFLDRYSPVVLYAARRQGPDYDAAMNRYRFALEELRRDDFSRLRGYSADGRSSFSNWLIVVTNRLCVDYHRKKYGRVRGDATEGDAAELRALRRRLLDFDVEPLKAPRMPDDAADDPEKALRIRERDQALADALAHLPALDRLLLKLRFEDDRPVRQIADLLEYPSVFHVYRRIKKLCAQLREDLEGRGVRGARP